MNILINFLISLTGLVLATDILVKLVEKLAAKIKISPLVIGATLIAFGTSLPETSVAFSSLTQNVPKIALGSIIGSNIGNLCLIFGLGIVLFPVRIGTQKTQRNNLILLLSTFLFIALFFIPQYLVSKLAYALLAFYLVFVIIEISWGEIGRRKEDQKALNKMPHLRDKPLHLLLGIAASIIALIVSANFLVASSIQLAEMLKVSQEIIGLTLIAVGTSLPELITTLIAGVRGDWKLISGNLQGSNIYNLAVLGTLTLVLKGKDRYEPAHYLSLIYLAGVTLLIFFLVRKFEANHIPRWLGLILMGLYAIYLILIL